MSESLSAVDPIHLPPGADQPMEVFPLLSDPAGYRCNTWDLLENPDKFTYWIDLFRRHIRSMRPYALAEAVDRRADADDAAQRFARVIADFDAYLDALAEQPDRFGPVGIMEICVARENFLRRHHFADPYRLAKREQNDTALPLLGPLLRELDALAPEALAERILRGVFAGNIFDLGATKTNDMFAAGGVDFHATLGKLRPRPWRIDDVDAWLERVLSGSAHRRAIVFVDNAGCDIVLGMIPFVRWLLMRGTAVVVTANTWPSLNDVTIDELGELMDRVAAIDQPIHEAMRTNRLTLIASGNGAPLIDLSRVSPELARAARNAEVDLVVLEGMGRAVETNLRAGFTTDSLKLAMIKDEGVAEALGGELFDLVMRYETGAQSEPRP